MIRISNLKFTRTKLIGFISRSNKKYKLRSSIIDKGSKICNITFNHKEISIKWKVEILEMNWITSERGKSTYLRKLITKINCKIKISMGSIMMINISCRIRSKSSNK